MQGNQEREPLAGQQPIPLIQILPDGRLAYVTLPMASLPQAPAQSYSAPQPAPQPSIQGTQNASEVKSSRDRWGCVIKTMGILMLLLALFGLATRACLAHRLKHKPQWVLWGIGLTVYTLMLLTAILGIRAGAKKTSSAAMCYLRFLVFFAVVFVIALVAASMLCIKMGEKHWRKGGNQWNQELDYESNENMPPGSSVPCMFPPPPVQPSMPSQPPQPSQTTQPFQPPQSFDQTNVSTTTSEAPNPDNFPEFPEGVIPAEPSDAYPSYHHEETTRRRKDKYGDKDEHHWSKEEIREGMMLGMFVVVLLSMGLCCSCVFCALRLVKFSKSYEALFPHENAVPQFNYVHHQPMQPMQQMQQMQPMQPMQQMQPMQPMQQMQQMQPMQPMQQMQQMQPMQPMQAQVEMHQYQAASPQVVQAVPLGQAGLYPNLAPVGSAVQYPRSS